MRGTINARTHGLPWGYIGMILVFSLTIAAGNTRPANANLITTLREDAARTLANQEKEARRLRRPLREHINAFNQDRAWQQHWRSTLDHDIIRAQTTVDALYQRLQRALASLPLILLTCVLSAVDGRIQRWGKQLGLARENSTRFQRFNRGAHWLLGITLLIPLAAPRDLPIDTYLLACNAVLAGVMIQRTAYFRKYG